MFLPKAWLCAMKWLNIPNAFLSFLLSKGLLSQLEYSAFGTRWLLPIIITHGLAPVLNQWRKITEMLLSDMFQRNYKPPTHKLAYQKPNMKNEVLTALSCKCDLTFRPPEACRLHFCGELGRFRFWFSSMLLKNGRLRGQLNGFVWSALLSNHWVFYNVFVRRGYLEAVIYASAKHLVYVLHF